MLHAPLAQHAQFIAMCKSLIVTFLSPKFFHFVFIIFVFSLLFLVLFCVPQDCRQFRQQIERPSSHDLVAPFESIDCDSCSFAAGAARATCNAQRVAWRRRILNLLQIILSNSLELELSSE